MASLKRDRDLAEMFDRFNRDYFGGRKPRYRVLRYPLRRTRGCCDTKRRRILIAQWLEGNMLTATLLHEMCHIGCPAHGRLFQDRIRRLLPLVSPSIASLLEVLEVKLPERAQLTLRDWISARLRSIAAVRPAAQWRGVRRVLIEMELQSPCTEPERRRQERRLALARREWAKISRAALSKRALLRDLLRGGTRSRRRRLKRKKGAPPKGGGSSSPAALGRS
jgi:GNAT superfamily N-acetyltransferase